ncbi:MAG TPA: PAS domain-containing protein, partial [Terriglobales bacterium]
MLLRTVLYHSSQAILIADDDRHCLDSSFGASKVLRLSRDEIVTRRIDELVAPSFRPRMAGLWRALLEEGAQDGIVPLLLADGNAREVGYVARGGVLPARHLFVVQDGTERNESTDPARAADRVPSWVRDCARVLLDADGRVAAWFSGAERIYGYKSGEVAGQDLSFLYSSEDAQGAALQEELTRAAAAGRFGSQGWHHRKDGSRLWTNALTVALRDD